MRMQDALADAIPPLGRTPGAPRGTPGGVPTPAPATPAPGTIQAAADAARAAAMAAPRSLDPANIAEPPRAAPVGGPAATLATPAAAPQQRAALDGGLTPQPPLSSGTQSGLPASQARAQTPPNLGGAAEAGAAVLGSGGAPAGARVVETPGGSAGGHSQLWGSAARLSQDSGPHVDATFRPAGEPAAAGEAASGADAMDVGPGDSTAPSPGGAAVLGTQAAAAGGGGGTGSEPPARPDGGPMPRADTSKFASHLERLAAAIRQDEEIRNAQMASAEVAGATLSGGRPEGAEKWSMREQHEDGGEPPEWPEEGEFAADDDEEDCLATPPDARPETVFM